MNKTVVFALLAVFCYAVGNVLLEQKFAKYNNLTLIAVYAAPILLVGIVGRQLVRTNDPSFDFPVGWEFGLLILLGFIFAAADYFYIGAYTNGGDLLTVTSILVMFPALAAMIKWLWVGGLPNMWQVSGGILAAVAVLLIAKGSSA